MKLFKYSFIVFTLITIFSSCEETADTYEDFKEVNMNMAVGKPLDVITRPGNNRVELSFVLTADPRISEIKITWEHEGQIKEKVVAVERKLPGIDTIATMIEPIEEGIKKFNVIARDKNGIESLSESETSMIYGDYYVEGLVARNIISMTSSTTENPGINSCVIKWSLPNSSVTKTVLIYTNITGKKITQEVSNKELTTEVLGYDSNLPLILKSEFAPEENALDKFWSKDKKIEFPKIEKDCDKSLWQWVGLDYDLPIIDPSFVDDANWKPFPIIWDGNASTGTAFLGANNSRPACITIDLGAKYVLSEFNVAPAIVVPTLGIRQYEIWGINDITNAEVTIKRDADNGDQWTKEMKDKGWNLIIDDFRANFEDAKTGFIQKLDNENQYKYVRIVIKETYLPSNADCIISEIGFKSFQ